MLDQYSDLYLKTDVLLLTDIFENFRDNCVASYGLDPAYYYSLSGFTWDAMLKHTRINFELHRHIVYHVYQTRYTQRLESMSRQVRVDQQQVHAIV